MELNLSCLPWTLHRWKSLKSGGYIPVFPLWPYTLLVVVLKLGWVSANAFKGLICLKICLCFCFVGYFLDTSSLWTGILEKCQCWHWGEGGKDVARGKQTSDLLWNWTCHSENFLEQKNFKDGGSGWCMYHNIFNMKELWESVFLASLEIRGMHVIIQQKHSVLLPFAASISLFCS